MICSVGVAMKEEEKVGAGGRRRTRKRRNRIAVRRKITWLGEEEKKEGRKKLKMKSVGVEHVVLMNVGRRG